MENDSYNIDNLEEYHNQIIEKIKNSDFGNLYEKNKQIITDNLRKYKIIHMEYGKYGKSEVRSYKNGQEWRSTYRDGALCPWSFIDNFYIIYISINGDCFGNYLSMYRPFEICINRFNHVCIDWNNELFEEPFNKGLSTISEKILTKTILEDTISKNIIQYFISKSNNFPNMCKVDVNTSSAYNGPQLDGVRIYKIFDQGFKFKNIFDLQEEYIPAKLEDKKRLEKEKEEEEEKEKQKRIEKVSKRIEEAQRKIKEEEKKEEEKELDRAIFSNKIINELIKDTNNYINYNEARSIISMIVYKDEKLWYFTKLFDRNIDTKLANQVLDKFASENEIRVKDSINIFMEHIVDIGNIFKINMDIHSNEYSKYFWDKMKLPFLN